MRLDNLFCVDVSTHQSRSSVNQLNFAVFVTSQLFMQRGNTDTTHTMQMFHCGIAACSNHLNHGSIVFVENGGVSVVN